MADRTGLDLDALIRMDTCTRSPAVLKEWKSGGESAHIVSSYIKLMPRGEYDVLRVDAMVGDSEDLGGVFEVFDEVCWIVSNFSLRVREGRYPENLPPMDGLERYLRSYLIDSPLVLSLTQRSISRSI